MVSIFVFAYYSYKDPVFQSAVLPYLKIASSLRLRVILLTWEQDQFNIPKVEKKQIKRNLLQLNIVWYDTSWHSGQFKLVKKAFDLVKGVVLSWFLIRRHRIKKVYSEGFPGAVIGHFLSKLTRTPHVVHTFEPHADYMVETGVWGRRDWEFRLLKALEIPIARHAESVITGTQAYRNFLAKQILRDRILVLPSCIDMNHYKFEPERRQEIRQHLGLLSDQIVIVYLGKLGGMYMDEGVFELFKYCLSLNERKFHFFLCTNENFDRVSGNLNKFNIPLNKVTVRHLERKDVPGFLSAADIGFCGIRPIRSRRYSSPIKNGEYWACGLPVLVPHGISDDYALARKYGIGFSFKTLADIDFSILESLTLKDRAFIQSKGHFLRSLEHYREDICKFFEDSLL